MICPTCGSWMIVCVKAIDLETNTPDSRWPAIAYFWWCACGQTMPGEIYKQAAEEEKSLDRWNRANARKPVVQYQETYVLLDPLSVPPSYSGMAFQIQHKRETSKGLAVLWVKRVGRVEKK